MNEVRGCLTALHGLSALDKKVSLVEYKDEDVELYHSWMQNDELLHLTGSERLSLAEEHNMCTIWRNSMDKCTYLIKYDCELVGDVNLFLQRCEYGCDLTSGCDCINKKGHKKEAEIEIMIVNPDLRRQGIAFTSLNILMEHGKKHHNITRFLAKCLLSNVKAHGLFKKLGYIECKRATFGLREEVHLSYETEPFIAKNEDIDEIVYSSSVNKLCTQFDKEIRNKTDINQRTEAATLMLSQFGISFEERISTLQEKMIQQDREKAFNRLQKQLYRKFMNEKNILEKFIEYTVERYTATG